MDCFVARAPRNDEEIIFSRRFVGGGEKSCEEENVPNMQTREQIAQALASSGYIADGELATASEARREAIHRRSAPRVDCFVARAPRNDGGRRWWPCESTYSFLSVA